MQSHRIKFCGMFMLGLATVVALTVVTEAQDAGANDIIVVNQDGEKVAAAEIQIIQPKPAGAQGTAAQAGRAGQIKVTGSVENKNGKWIVTDADGNEKEIDIQGAKSIIVNQSVESVNENGENKTKRVGKAIIIGPDGKRHEIELGRPMDVLGNAAQFEFPGFNGIVRAEQVNNSFMVGVNCQPVSDALRAQLQLDDETGLVVLNVTNDSPAQTAGIKAHDILMFADDQQLTTQSDLAEAVQTAGKQKGKISLTLIRGGKEMGIDVSPVERPETEMVGGMPGIFRAFPEENGRGFKMQFRQMGPGLIMGGDEDFQKQVEAQMKEVEARMEAVRKQMDEKLNRGQDK